MKRNVLIVDDDRNFRYAMREIIPWKESGFEVAAEAVHGKQAMEILEQTEIHIVLTDMEMPVMNGVKLTEAVKKQYPDIIVVALSAYDDFEFVRESMRLGAEDYILKQEFDGETIIKTLKELCLKQQEKKKQDFSEEQAQRELLAYIQGKAAHRALAEKQYKEWTGRCNLTLCTVHSNRDFVMTDAARYQEKLVFFLKTGDTSWLFLFQMPETRSKREEAEFQQDMISGLNHGFSGEFQVGLCDSNGSLSQLPELYQKAEAALGYAMYFPEKKMFHFLDMRRFEETRTRDYLYEPPKNQSEWCGEEAESMLAELVACLSLYKPEEEFVNKSFVNAYKEYRKGILSGETEIEVISFYEEIKGKRSISEKADYMKDRMQKEKEQMLIPYEGTNQEIRKALEYVYRHYAQDISLKVMAETTGLSENYFSWLFKQEVGENLVSFINRVRIENAKKLLQNQTMKVYEIAEAVGYRNATYLSTMFKKVTGVSISEYKNQN